MNNQTNNNLIERIEEALEETRPFLKKDEGNVEFVSFEKLHGILEIRFLGNCKGCPMSVMTLRAGIEKLVKFRISEVKRIESVN